MSSGFHRDVTESCGLLGYYAASNNTEERNSHYIRLLVKIITCHVYALTGLHKTTVASYSSNLTDQALPLSTIDTTLCRLRNQIALRRIKQQGHLTYVGLHIFPFMC
jgi:hypothetical protein